MNIILGIITSLMGSIGGTYRKKASDNSSLANGLFVLMAPFIGIFFVYTLVFFMGINIEILTDTKVILLLICAGIVDGLGSIFEAGIYKKVKISKILPYTSFDKLFVIVIGFILFYGNEGYTSINTLIVSILTVLIIIGFSLDFKSFKIEREIILYIGVKLMYAIATLIIGSILLKYTTIDIFSILILAYISFHLIINYLLKNDFKQIFKQTKIFYKYRIFSSIVGRGGFILGFFIIESSGVLIASLLSFIAIVFSILGMKFILNDTPTKKQVILAFSVIILIGIGYSLK